MNGLLKSEIYLSPIFFLAMLCLGLLFLLAWLGFRYNKLKHGSVILQLKLESEIQALESESQHELKVQAIRAEEQRRAFKTELATLSSVRVSLTKEFENISNRLFDAKQTQFSITTKAQMEGIVLPFQQQLQNFQQRADDFHRQDAAHRNQLMGQISELQKQSLKIGEDAINLTNALKGNNKLQGCWGEVILVKVLEQSGLLKGREFDVQVSEVSKEGKRYQPDVVVHLPDGKDIVIDAKVSLTAYERFMTEESETQRLSHLKEHFTSIRSQVKNLASKKYHDLEGLHSLDFVFLFVPIDMALVCVNEKAPELLQEAYTKGVVVVSPSSLLAVLRTVEALWQRDRQDRSVEKIVDEAGKLYDQFVRFLDSMTEIGVGLDKASTAYQQGCKRLYEGRGNLIKRSENLKKLGAKVTKSIPEDIMRTGVDV